MDLLHKYGADYKVVFVGDAAMAPYEITQPGGSVEHWNEEAGYVWMKRFMEKYKKLDLDQPLPQGHLGLHRLDQHRARADRGPDVSR